MSRGDPSVPYPLGLTQSVSYTGTAGRTSSGVGAQTRVVAISASTDCYYLFGPSDVDATTSAGTFLRAGGEHFVKIRGGQYVSAIRDSEDGDLKVSEFGY